MDWSQLYHTLDSMFNTEDCLQEVKSIWENDHWFSRDKFCLTAEYCAETMEKAGLTVEKLPLKADGKTKYFDWKMPIGWDAEKAILSYADGEVIADYSRMPCQLTMYCPSTPGAVEGEVIVPDDGIAAVGSGGNYAMAAARALQQNTDLSAKEIAEKALHIAADICVFTNHNVIVEEV